MSQETKQPKRRWLRFSLRSFLIVVVFLSAWLGWYLYRVEQQREAVKWVEENGGHVWYDYDLLVDGQPPVPKWLHDLLGVDYFSTATVVSVTNPQVSDVTPLATLKNLQSLHLSRTQVSDLTPLDGLTNLGELYLEKTQISDLQPLAGLKNLESLNLGDTQVSDLQSLAGLRNLKDLALQLTPVSDLQPLAGLKNLESLNLQVTQVSDLTPLAGLKNLKDLRLNYTQVSDEEIEKLKLALPNCIIEQ